MPFHEPEQYDGPGWVDDLVPPTAIHGAAWPSESDELETVYEFLPGGSFILDTPATPEPLWGRGEEVLLADGEALIIAGGQGLGKTTLAQQLALGRAGFTEYATLLGYPIAPGDGRVLYLAMDRPRQAARSFRRMVGDAWRDQLNDRISVWQGPPPHDLARVPALLARLCEQAGADTVIVDSLKDAALGLTDDDAGAGYNRARQHAVSAGVQVIELHHNRKSQHGARGSLGLDDLYGSTWITSGAGSVLLLTGQPGDPVVKLHHLKQPAAEVGPLEIGHDHEVGRSTLVELADLVEVARGMSAGISAVGAARTMFDVETPSNAQKAKARRRLDKLTREGRLHVIAEADPATSTPMLWGAK